ncbi:unnamed protein product [Rhizoctonia solani]|uniref:Protein kinase domain-containing protein n=1 Tax=Rhizoctonia solani TaxID=456999 RepID=A0A8H2X0W4_9AGAM|nr:unnamed protein product [Rhizoctonia solani]
MYQSSIVFSATSASQAGSVRWAAPELLSENPVKTKQSDLYALGMTILEVMTGTIPYPECTWDFNVMMKVSQGILPTRPASHIQDDQYGNQLWDLLVSCWGRNPDARPSAGQTANSLTLISSLSM